ncbi:DUF1682 domain-protein [Diplogelasinospora grovesii]|uniref:DUF1682 domain-protein n=1 Tax=Diplogelasinospora grovesii TaxID=303347 RepID=A0AAN6S6J5_9PEZI|nr:DUF1682 domain-protein [Diplogelasinospora grovesii]
MANVINNLFGGSKSSASPDPVKSADSDFADFAEGVDPSPAPIVEPVSQQHTLGGALPAQTARPYTKWYNIHERHTLDEFKGEAVILSSIAVLLLLYFIGASWNRNKAKKWIRAHAAPLASEFALVGFSGVPAAAASAKSDDELVQALADSVAQQGDSVLREESLFEYATYATGRANVAFLDVKLTLQKRFNPIMLLVEWVMGFFMETMGSPTDNMQAILYPFDGKEADTVPGLPGAAELRANNSKSAFDGFVWALVHKESMKQVREDRYDVSLTSTKDHPKLPNWLTVMSESAEITDMMLTPELIKAAEAAGDNFEYLIVSDQPMDKPKTLDETVPRKRAFLKYRLPSNDNYDALLPIFRYFLRVADVLVQSARFRPEVLRKVKAVREEAIKQIKKADEDEKAEERTLEREKAKKAKRDAELNALDAKAQKKYLEKEREKEMRKKQKKQTSRA